MSHRLALLGLVGCVLLGGALAPARAAPLALAVAQPVLKWQYGGCAAPPHYCDTGWYASPAVADLDKDGKPEVIWGGYKLFALNGEDGSTQWSAPNGSRIWPAVAVADLDGDGSTEVVVGRGGDQVTAYSAAGAALWTQHPFGGGEVRTLALSDLEGDGRYEVVVGRASGGDTKQVSVYEPDGSLRPGWPARHDGEAGYGWGMYNENIAIADMNGDGRQEIFAPTDTHYITGLAPDGSQLPVSPIYAPRTVWSQVGVHVDQAADLRGYANCGSEHRPNFANAAPTIADMDGDGTLELVVPGDVYNCDVGDPAGDMYYLPWILKADRTRWSGGGFDWTVLPTPVAGSGALSQDYNVIENAVMNAVAADLDGDGRREILYPSYDGRLHTFWLDKTEHGAWPFKVPGSGMRFASEPVVADLNSDGQAEVIFTSWPEVASGQVGQLFILDSQGHQLYAVDLPAAGAGATWNGGLGAPTIANIDADADLELVIGTSHSGAVAYD
ncbi:MAG: VCBS repeat-containing protein, partial [Chloroflexales bacterium]